MKTLQQRFCRHQGKTSSIAIAGQSPGRHTGKRVEESQVVGVGIVASGNTQTKRTHMLLRHLTKFALTTHFPRQP
ncbi:hypothetical protein SDC9_174638 [bioreactor metagenome]|uniref:Uncharacterized protein n=1 Tax=bioreactor metagenome TaxID=1076179 RepID=A0A645GM14_9ZZZZ